MNLEVITIQDCLDMREKKRRSVVINDGKVVGFTSENEN